MRNRTTAWDPVRVAVVTVLVITALDRAHGQEGPEPTDKCYAFEEASGVGGLSGWTTFSTGELDVPWGTNDDGICDPSIGNNTGGVGAAACIDPRLAAPGDVDSYLCSGEIEFWVLSHAAAEFRYTVLFTGGPGEGFEPFQA